jgi:hypothetical protein
METSKLERYRRVLADRYMEEHPGTPRQVAKRRVDQQARILLSMSAITVEANRSIQAMRHFSREVGKVANQITSTWSNAFPVRAEPFGRAEGRRK